MSSFFSNPSQIRSISSTPLELVDFGQRQGVDSANRAAADDARRDLWPDLAQVEQRADLEASPLVLPPESTIAVRFSDDLVAQRGVNVAGELGRDDGLSRIVAVSAELHGPRKSSPGNTSTVSGRCNTSRSLESSSTSAPADGAGHDMRTVREPLRPATMAVTPGSSGARSSRCSRRTSICADAARPTVPPARLSARSRQADIGSWIVRRTAYRIVRTDAGWRRRRRVPRR